MKRIAFTIAAAVLAISLAACGNTEKTAGPPAQTAVPDTAKTQESAGPEEAAYAFEFADIDGNIHRLSDYKGKPVYLRVWASWCGVCLSSLEALDTLAGEAEDFAVLSVVMPGVSGEMSAEDFTAWYQDFGYENLTVLLDPGAQIARDFGINAFPSQIMFDAEGRVAFGTAGLLDTGTIKQLMAQIAKM